MPSQLMHTRQAPREENGAPLRAKAFAVVACMGELAGQAKGSHGRSPQVVEVDVLEHMPGVAQRAKHLAGDEGEDQHVRASVRLVREVAPTGPPLAGAAHAAQGSNGQRRRDQRITKRGIRASAHVCSHQEQNQRSGAACEGDGVHVDLVLRRAGMLSPVALSSSENQQTSEVVFSLCGNELRSLESLELLALDGATIANTSGRNCISAWRLSSGMPLCFHWQTAWCVSGLSTDSSRATAQLPPSRLMTRTASGFRFRFAMQTLNHALTSRASTCLSEDASENEAHLLEVGEEFRPMDLDRRLEEVAKHLIAQNRIERRRWRRAMAQVAGCSYQNIYQASKGINHDMDDDMLRRIAAWAGVSEKFMVDGVGPMIIEAAPEDVARVAADVERAREHLSGLGAELAQELDSISDPGTRRRAFVAAMGAIGKYKP